MKWGSLAALSLGVLAFAAWDASAQDLEPRAYSNTPTGMNFLLAGYAYSTGTAGPDAAVPLTDTHVNIHTAFHAYARSLDVWGTSGKVDVILPYSWASGSGVLAGHIMNRDVDGFGDARFRLSVNLYGAPALTLKEFESYEQDTIIGVSVQVVAPTGQYDSEKLLNIGSNRWSFKPEFGISKAWGPLILELTPAVTFYTNNDDFLKGHTLEQAPIYSVQGHLIYTIWRGIWASLDATYYTGGRTTLNGVEADNRQENVRVGASFALPVDRYNSIKLFASGGVYSRTGNSFTTGGIAWQVRWGAGL